MWIQVQSRSIQVIDQYGEVAVFKEFNGRTMVCIFPVSVEARGLEFLMCGIRLILVFIQAFPGDASGKELTCQYRRCKRCRFNPSVGKIPWRKKWQPTPVLLPGESHGQRSLMGYGPWGRKESDTTEATQNVRRSQEVAHRHIYFLNSSLPALYVAEKYSVTTLGTWVQTLLAL